MTTRVGVNVVGGLVRDRVANLVRYVEGNLSHGADHVVVLLDVPDPEAECYLAAHPHVTHAVLDDRFWASERSSHLNHRQRMAANLIRAALVAWGDVDWFFFLDGDEVALLPDEVLDTVGEEWLSCRLRPLEKLSGGRDDEFKKLLRRPRLQRLHEAGVIAAPTNGHLFRGHVAGKVGIRPRWDVRSSIHVGLDARGEKLPSFEHPALRHLHLESPTYEEFVRKMGHLTSSPTPPVMRAQRQVLAEEFRSALAEPAPDARAARLRALFEQRVMDDAEALRRARAVVRVPLRGDRLPRAVAPDRQAELEQLLETLMSLGERMYRGTTPVDVLRERVRAVTGR